MLNQSWKMLAISLLLSPAVALAAYPCTFSYSENWTATVTYSCSQDVDLTHASLQFTTDNSQGISDPNSVWGFENMPWPNTPVLNINGNSVTYNFSFPSYVTSPVILKAGQSSTISFNITGQNNVNLSNFSLSSGASSYNDTINFVTASGSSPIPADTTISLTGSNSYQVPFSQGKLQNIAYGTYQVSASAQVNGQTVAINVDPSSINVSSNSTQQVQLSYTNNAADLFVTLATGKPSDVSSNTVTMTATDVSNNSPYNLNVSWGQSADLSGLTAGHTYKLAANPVVGSINKYNFNYSIGSTQITQITLNKGQNNLSMTAVASPLPTGTVAVTINGLPSQQLTNLHFTGNNDTYNFTNVGNGNSSYTLPGSTSGISYNLTADSIINAGKQYSVQPVSVKVITNTTTAATESFTATPIPQGVKGWPQYIAMGAITDDAAQSGQSLQTRPVDAIFKYSGFNGMGDLGQIEFPIFSLETALQAQSITNAYQQQGIKNVVKPVMVEYTADMSYGTEPTDFAYDNMTKHLINLMMDAQMLQSFKTAQNPYPGSLILDPDFSGSVEQNGLILSINSALASNGAGQTVQDAAKVVACFATYQINYNGKMVNYFQLYNTALNGGGDYWGAMATWNQYQGQFYNTCMQNPVVPSNIVVPNFSNDVKGWAQANNWIIRTFAPDVTFGWQENLWATGTSNWVHGNYSSSQLQSNYINPVVNALTAIGSYNSGTSSYNFVPDFIVFDKYEMDDIPAAYSIGYTYNARDWDNVMAYVGGISQGLGNMPVMLWQIPGGHLQVVGDIDTRGTHASTSPDYFFGDSYNPLNNLQAYITNLTLPVNIYGMSSMPDYLAMSENGSGSDYNWQVSHMALAAQNHVFAILWGGGNTTSVGTFPSDDNGWLSAKINNYYLNPTPVK